MDGKQTESEHDPPPDLDQDQTIDKDHHQSGRGFSMAVKEVRADPQVKNPRKVAEYRYNENPEKYDSAFDSMIEGMRRQACTRCDDSGWAWVKPDGTATTRDEPGSESHRCDHKAIEVADVS